MSYQVFIDGISDPSKTQQVAAAIGKRYGLPSEAVAQRLAAGRFRVKKNIDLATAQQFAADLVLLGAKASIEEYTAEPAASQEAVSAQIPAVLPPAEDAPAPASRPEQTGLSAALAGEAQTDLGALNDAASFSLASLDGSDESPPASTPTAAQPSKSSPPPPPKAVSEDAFLPPDATEEEPVLVIDAPPPPPRTEAPSPVAAAAVAPPNPADIAMAESEEETTRGNPLLRLWQALGDSLRLRFAVGVFIIVVVTFIPVHLYATMTENTAFSKIRSEVHEMQGLVEDVDEWNALEQFRRGALERMDAKRVNIAITGSLLWAVMIGGLCFIYFRKLPWPDRGPRIAK